MSRKPRQGEKILTSLEELKTAFTEPQKEGDFGAGDFVFVFEEGIAFGKMGIVLDVGQFSATVGFFDGRLAFRSCIIPIKHLVAESLELWREWKHRNPLKRQRKKTRSKS